jgi:hypothetical protein
MTAIFIYQSDTLLVSECEMSTLEDTISRIFVDIRKSAKPLCIYPIVLYLWLDTDQTTCEAIKGNMSISFEVDEGKIFAIFRAVDKVTPIYSIKVGTITYHITKTEKFMNKRCDAC